MMHDHDDSRMTAYDMAYERIARSALCNVSDPVKTDLRPSVRGCRRRRGDSG